MITSRGIKSGPVAFLEFLSLKPYLTIETTTQDKKRRVRHLLVRKGAQARKADRHAGAQARKACINDG